jgi:phytoene dehydrogenase-like protein
MPNKVSYDAVVVGAGPNGLAAAIRLAQEKLSVLVLEANNTIGGGTRSAELTVPGFTHDVCSAVHPLGIGSPFFRTLRLERYGLHWVHPQIPLAHPLERDAAAVLYRSTKETAAACGADESIYQNLMGPLVDGVENLSAEILQPLLHWPRHPVQLMRFGQLAVQSTARLIEKKFKDPRTRALFAGLAAHSFLPLESRPSAAFGLVLGLLAHAVGWPMARGGSQRIADALAAHLRYLGGEIQTGFRVEHVDQLPLARATLFDLTPLQLLLLLDEKVPSSYNRRLGRYRYGPGVFKIDYALNAAIPWRNEFCSRAGTLHIGGTFEEIAASEREVSQGKIPERPFVLLAQPTLVDSSRAPVGKQIAWAYCHVPNGSTFDMAERIEKQIERFAPGFRDCILARHTMNCEQMETKNANLVGGDINGGSADLRQLLARPIFSPTPYRIPVPGYYLCSSSTPPGGGVHGMCGFYAAEAALRDCFR